MSDLVLGELAIQEAAAAGAASGGALLIATGFLEATVRTATPLAFASLGECVSERAGVINIGLEGSILTGALAATVAAGTLGVSAGFAAGAFAGLLVAALFALFTVLLRADQIITGTAITMLSLGLTGTLYRTLFGTTGVALSTPTAGAVDLPGLSSLPLVGAALFHQPVATYAVLLLAPVVGWFLRRTTAGLALRALGEYPDAAIAAGIPRVRTQALAVLFAGAMAGLAGATLVLAQAGTFVEGMSAGRGFIAIAIVVLGRWSPLGTLGASLLFGAANSLQVLFQSMGWTGIPYQLFLALPYAITLVVLATAKGAEAPAALGAK